MRAFTLVELAMVLVIIGLIVGGVLVGKDMIRLSELRVISSEADTFIASFYTFRNKYGGYPGDFDKATNFWPSAGGTGQIVDPACYTNATRASGLTCNGNGNERLDSHDPYFLWQQLALAGMISGTYGTDGMPANVAGINCPASRISAQAGWYIGYAGTVNGSANAFNGFFGDAMNVFARTPTVRGILTGAEAKSIDGKVDDGKPGRGRVISNWSATYSDTGTPCTNAINGADTAAEYQASNTTKDCGLFWLRIF